MKIIISPYNPLWKSDFEKEKNIIAAALKGLNPQIEHIGSTSIEGLAAKPIIDILLGVQNESDLNRSIEPMQETGYTYVKKYEPLMPYRRYFVRYVHPENLIAPIIYDKGVPELRDKGFYTVTHIHALLFNSEHWIRHIAFRDYLNENAEIRKQYEALKLELSKRNFENSLQYNDAKNDFVKLVEGDAVLWFNKHH